MVPPKGLLQPAEAAGWGQPFNGRDLVTPGLRGEEKAGTNRQAVEEHRAGATDPVLAAEVGAGEGEAVAKKVGEGPGRWCQHFHLLPIDTKGDDLLPHACLGYRRAA